MGFVGQIGKAESKLGNIKLGIIFSQASVSIGSTIIGTGNIDATLIGNGYIESLIANISNVSGNLNFYDFSNPVVPTATGSLNNVIYADTSSTAVLIELPTNPNIGDGHLIIDYSANAENHFILIKGNGKTINGLSEIKINENNGFIHLLFNGIEWNIINNNYKEATLTLNINSDIVLENNQEFIFVDLNDQPVEITLPANPKNGQKHHFKDVYGVSFFNNLTILGNGKNVETLSGSIENSYIFNQEFNCITYQYNGIHWSII